MKSDCEFMLSLRQRVKEYFQKPGTVSKWWDPEYQDSLFKEELARQVDTIVSVRDFRAGRVLDVAAGKGRLSIALARTGCQGVSAVDISGEMLTEIRRRANQQGVAGMINLFEMDAEEIAFADESFDLVACLEALVHIPRPDRALKEFRRVLREDGLLAISVTLPIRTRTWLDHLSRVKSWTRFKEWMITPAYSSRFYRNYLRRLLRRPEPYGREIPESFITKALEAAEFRILVRIPMDHPKNPRHLLLMANKTR